GAFSASAPGEGWRVTWQMPNGKFPDEQPVTWTEWGSASGNFTIPETAPPGMHKIFLLSPKERFIVSFQVTAAGAAKPVRLDLRFTEGMEVTPEGTRAVFGDKTVKGAGVLTLSNGRPLPNEKIILGQPGQAEVEVRSGADGTVPFSFSTA